jgi:uncharacterized protein (UPF0548 family)
MGANRWRRSRAAIDRGCPGRKTVDRVRLGGQCAELAFDVILVGMLGTGVECRIDTYCLDPECDHAPLIHISPRGLLA